ncbi:hypothetical protein D3C76_518410 [compost metagenome]
MPTLKQVADTCQLAQIKIAEFQLIALPETSWHASGQLQLQLMHERREFISRFEFNFDGRLRGWRDWFECQVYLLNMLSRFIQFGLQMKAVKENPGLGQFIFIDLRIQHLRGTFAECAVRVADEGKCIVPSDPTTGQRAHIVQYRFDFRLNQDVGQRSIITGHPVSILNLIGTVETLKPVCRLTFESWLQLDNRRITYCRFSRVESQAFRFDNDGLIQEAIHTGTSLARQLPDAGPADLVSYFTRLILLSQIKLPYRTGQFPQ